MNQDIVLNERQKDILQTIVSTYIMTASAVGSRTVAKKLGFKLSPASVRNVMADLEEMGFVRQPHTSAGRIPTDIGYRIYVNDLMGLYELALDELSSIEGLLEPEVGEVEELLELVCRLLSLLTKYTAVVQTPRVETETIKHVELISLSTEKVLIILVTSLGEVRKRAISRPAGITDEEIENFSTFLNTEFNSLTFSSARSLLNSFSELAGEDLKVKFARQAVDIMEGLFVEEPPRDVLLGGMENIISQPEFQDSERLRPVLRILDEKRQLNELLENFITGSSTTGVYIRIGAENPVDGIRNCSIIASPYAIGEQMMGIIGVIGPTRMQYARTSSLVAGIADKLGHILTILSGGE